MAKRKMAIAKENNNDQTKKNGNQPNAVIIRDKAVITCK